MTNDIYAHLTQADYESEVWRDIEGYEGLYQVSSLGRVKSLARNIYRKDKTLMRTQGEQMLALLNVNGYVRVNLVRSGIKTQFSVHRLVALAFIDNPKNYPQVNHINGIKNCNYIKNLEWCDASYNMLHAIESGLKIVIIGETHKSCKVTDEECQKIKEKYIYGNVTQKQLAIEHCINQSQVSRIVSGERRKYLSNTKQNNKRIKNENNKTESKIITNTVEYPDPY